MYPLTPKALLLALLLALTLSTPLMIEEKDEFL
jgi:hypothetical protein